MKHYPHYLITLARELRQRATEAEKVLWEELRNHRLEGMKFRRQHHIGRYIVDFYCADESLVVELEGSVHEEHDQKEYDAYRFAFFDALGLRVLRFHNDEVLQSTMKVLTTIASMKSNR
jgi:very-short-patch-repair endonuclease